MSAAHPLPMKSKSRTGRYGRGRGVRSFGVISRPRSRLGNSRQKRAGHHSRGDVSSLHPVLWLTEVTRIDGLRQQLGSLKATSCGLANNRLQRTCCGGRSIIMSGGSMTSPPTFARYNRRQTRRKGDSMPLFLATCGLAWWKGYWQE